MANKFKGDSDLARRIAQAIEISGVKQAKFARVAGIGESMLSRWKAGENEPTPTSLAKIARIANCDPGWLLTGEGSMVRGEPPPRSPLVGARHAVPVPLTTGQDGEFIGIPMVRGRISAGGGLEPDNTIELRLSFRADWVKRKGDPAMMSMIRVQGDSMEPTLESGDLVLIDHNKNHIDAQGGIYALAVDGEIMLKRVQIVRSIGQARIISDNQKYEVEVVRADNLVVNGKAIWYGREMER